MGPVSPRRNAARSLVLFGLALVLLATAVAPVSAAEGAVATPASAAARRFADWVVASGDNGGLGFLVIDKTNAQVAVFYPDGRLRGAAPGLLGMAVGDDSAPGIGQRKLASITPAERTTPAGRFVGSIGADLGQKDVIWVDYDAGVSLHRVFTGSPKERRLQRLATATVADNRISYGCINVSVGFYETVVSPTFKGANGIVYILPEVRGLRDVFPLYGAPAMGSRP